MSLIVGLLAELEAHATRAREHEERVAAISRDSPAAAWRARDLLMEAAAAASVALEELQELLAKSHDELARERGVFGVWDAPFTDDLATIAAPVGARCCHCREAVADGDNGAVLNFGVVHRECHYRAVVGGIGHHVDHARYCRSELGPDAGLSTRASSLLVWALLIERRSVSEADLERAREAA